MMAKSSSWESNCEFERVFAIRVGTGPQGFDSNTVPVRLIAASRNCNES